MEDIKINLQGGTSKKLLTKGKLCDRDIIVTAEEPSYEFYGSHILDTPFNLVITEDVRFECPSGGILGYFYDFATSKYEQLRIKSISFFKDLELNIEIVAKEASGTLGNIRALYFNTTNDQWLEEYGGQLCSLPDDTFRVLEFPERVELNKKVYDLLNSIITNNNDFDASPYSIGVAAGYRLGRTQGFEALGALCEWQVMSGVESSGLMVGIRNKHPSYYLHCDVATPYSTVQMVIPPYEYRTYSEQETLETDDIIKVTNMRWKSSAT